MAVSHQDMKFYCCWTQVSSHPAFLFPLRFRSASSSPCLEFKQFSSRCNKWETALVSCTITVQTRILILIRHEVGFYERTVTERKRELNDGKTGANSVLSVTKQTWRGRISPPPVVPWRGCRCWGTVVCGAAQPVCFASSSITHWWNVIFGLLNARFRRTSPFPPIVSIWETSNRLK